MFTYLIQNVLYETVRCVGFESKKYKLLYNSWWKTFSERPRMKFTYYILQK